MVPVVRPHRRTVALAAVASLLCLHPRKVCFTWLPTFFWSSTYPSLSADGRTSRQTNDPDPQRGPSVPPPNGAGSEVDKLFAKLRPQAPSDNIPPATSGQGWLLLNGRANGSTPSPAPEQGTSTRGLSLLNSIFASVQPSSSSVSQSLASVLSDQFTPYQPPSRYLPPHPEEIQIVSPKPTSSALPQILNQDVISTLLGLSPDPSSRASSVAPSSASSRHSSSRPYDDEYEHSDAGHGSEYSLQSHTDPAILEVSTSLAPANSFVHSAAHAPSPTQVDGHSTDDSRKGQGDATPRMPTRGIGPASPPLLDRTLSQQYLTSINGSILKSVAAPKLVSPSPNSAQAVMDTVTSTAPPESSHPRSRALIPFEADSELWPYPRAPVDERSPDLGESDVVELDFSDTRALSDPVAFSNCLKEKQQKQKQNGKKKSRRERALEREREREAIENGWDDPTQGQAKTIDMVTNPGAPTPISPPSPPAPPTPSQAPAPPAINGKTKPSVNGAPARKDSVEPNAVHPILLAAVASHPKAPARDVSRKQFVQEVLSLIYVRLHSPFFIMNALC